MDLNVTIHVHHHDSSPEMAALVKQGKTIMTALTNLAAQVAAAKTVSDSAVELLTGLHAKLVEALAASAASAVDNAAIQALADSLGAEIGDLATAVTANTDAAPADPTPADPAPADPIADPTDPAPVVPPIGGGDDPIAP